MTHCSRLPTAESSVRREAFGSFAVQMANAFGAHVTGVCSPLAVVHRLRSVLHHLGRSSKALAWLVRKVVSGGH